MKSTPAKKYFITLEIMTRDGHPRDWNWGTLMLCDEDESIDVVEVKEV